ncbi:MAG: glycogen/starch/alpha-glucan phosphorylase [Thiobacillaceae bacterium]|nr:glycogen/starch/alpha-glucan phosphorylase [Thiobacillaceae bacterium]
MPPCAISNPVCSHEKEHQGQSVNGVARLHSDLLVKTVMQDFAALWSEKLCNVVNGVTPRRFAAVGNPPLAELVTSEVGEDWLRELGQLRRLEPLAEDATFQCEWREVKLAARRRVA